MLRSVIVLAAITATVGACTPRQYSFAEAHEMCEEKADAARGPQGTLSASVGTGGPSASLGISVSDSFLRGEDPQVVYDVCMNNLEANGQIVGGTQ